MKAREPWVVAAAIGVALDRILPEPPSALHPVAAFGRVMSALEHLVWRDSRLAGVAYAGVGVALGAGVGALMDSTAPAQGHRHDSPVRNVPFWHLSYRSSAAALATTVAVGGRALGVEARRVAAALTAGDIDAARALLPNLCGRDPDTLDELGIVRAVVESVAENTTDAVVAPALCAVAAGAAGALGYRAVNTLDAMVGYHNDRYERFGWASARLDDIANWAPARATALLVAAVRPGRARGTLRTIWHPPAHPSPNAGVSEAAFAVALGVRLGGDTAYGGRVERRPEMGSGRTPEVADIEAAVALSRDVSAALAVLLLAWGRS